MNVLELLSLIYFIIVKYFFQENWMNEIEKKTTWKIVMVHFIFFQKSLLHDGGNFFAPIELLLYVSWWNILLCEITLKMPTFMQQALNLNRIYSIFTPLIINTTAINFNCQGSKMKKISTSNLLYKIKIFVHKIQCFDFISTIHPKLRYELVIEINCTTHHLHYTSWKFENFLPFRLYVCGIEI